MPRIKSFFSNLLVHLKTHKKILLLIIPVIVLISFFIFNSKNKTVIATQKVTEGDLVQSISVTGSIEAQKFVNLSFLTGGKLVYLPIKKGDSVKANSVIATIDQRSAQKNLQNALLSYSQQRNAYDQTNDNNKDKPLTDTLRRILTDNEYDLEKASISVDLMDLAKQQSVLTTPIAGIITRQDVEVAGVNVIATNVFQVTDPNSLDFRMEVDEADIGKVNEGQKIEVNLDSYPDETLNLKISSIDFVTHTTSTGGDAYYVTAKLTNDNTNYKYRVGMNGNAQIILGEKNNVIIIPLSSIFDDNKVYVKVNNKYEKRTVKLGSQSDTDSEVVSGLNVNEEVVLDPTLVK